MKRGRKRKVAGTGGPHTRPSRISRDKIVGNLRLASRKGDRAALALALAEMRTLALSPKYWERYLVLLRNPLARLVDLLTIKQGERIAHMKGWKLPRPVPPDERRDTKKHERPTRARSAAASAQPSLFDLS